MSTIEDDIRRLSKNTSLAADKQHRQSQLENIQKFLQEQKENLINALQEDMKTPFEANSCWSSVMSECKHAITELNSWMECESIFLKWLPFRMAGYKARTRPIPLGMCYIVSTWNFPLHLSLVPLIGAIAAGNCVLLKLAERAPATSEVLLTLNTYVDTRTLLCVLIADLEGQKAVCSAYPWDAVFFTGSRAVGQEIAKQVINNSPLCRLTLELGGKNPAVIYPDVLSDPNNMLRIALERIVVGKMFVSGQCCVAPDHLIYVSAEDRTQELMDIIDEHILRMYNEKEPRCRLVNTKSLNLLEGIDGSHIRTVGQDDVKNGIYGLRLVDASKISRDHKLMQEEIFGPILPIVRVPSVEALPRHLPKDPLVAYVFNQLPPGNNRLWNNQICCNQMFSLFLFFRSRTTLVQVGCIVHQ